MKNKKAITLLLCATVLTSISACTNGGSNSESSVSESISNNILSETIFDPAVTTSFTATDLLSTDETVTLQNTDHQDDDIITTSLISPLCDFSDGLCWVKIQEESNYSTLTYSAIIDAEGHILAKHESIYSSYGKFQNGYSLITKNNQSKMFVDKSGNVVFSAMDEEYHDMIQGMYDGGYIYMTKEEAGFDSKNYYGAIISPTKEFIKDWFVIDETIDYYHYYLGEGVFVSMADGNFDYQDVSSAKFINVETGKELYIAKYSDNYDGINVASMTNQPYSIVDISDGWIIVDDSERMYGTEIAIDTTTCQAYPIDSFYDEHNHGICSDKCIVLIGTKTNGNTVNRLGIFDTETKEYIPINYEYMSQIVLPDPMVRGYSNMITSIPQSSIRSSVPECVDMRYSDGAMLLNLNGKDGKGYFSLIDKQGNSIIEPVEGEAIGTMGHGRFVVNINGEMNVINQKGEYDFWNYDKEAYGTIIEYSEYSEGLAFIKTNSGFTGFIDVDGNIIIEKDLLINN